MSGLESPAYGTPERQPGVAPSDAGRCFEARHERREAVAAGLVGVVGAIVVGVGAFFLAGVGLAGSLLGADSLPAEAGVFRIVALVMLVFFLAFGCALATVVVSGLVRALRRSLIVRIDADGVILEPRRSWGAARFVPWSAVRGVSAYSTSQRDEDGTSTTHWFQVDLTDGTIERRRLDRHRYSWAALAEVVRAVAPRTSLTVEGELPPGRS